MNAPRATAGFSLVEVLLIVAIIGLLLGVALPALETSRRVLERRPFVVDEARVLDPGVQGRVTFEYIPAGVKDWVRFRTLPL